MADLFWKIVTLLLTSAVMMGLYFVLQDVIYGNELTTKERVIYYCILLAVIFGGGILLDRRR
jgi:drug/metabolite transporter (DMT)-like permease